MSNRYKWILYGYQYQAKIEYYILFKIQNNENDDPKSQFSKLNKTTIYFALFTFLQSHTQQTSNKLLLIVSI